MTETSNLLSESKQKRKKYLRGVGVLILISSGLFYWWWQGSDGEEAGVEAEKYAVERLDIRDLVESEGRIINPDIANLSFLINGTLGELNVEEGDQVTAGTILAKLDTTDLEFDRRDAQNGVNIAYANITATKADLTDTQVLDTSSELEQANETYAATKRSAEQRIAQATDDLDVLINGIFPKIEQTLQDVDNVLGVERRNSGDVLIISVFNDAIRESRVKNKYQQTRLKLDTLRNEFRTVRKNQAALSNFSVKLRTLLLETKNLTDELAILLKSAQPSSFVTANQIATARSTNAGNSNAMNAEANALTNATQAIETAKLGRQNDLNNARKSLDRVLVRLENSQRNQSRLETNKSTGLDILYAQLAQSRLRVDKANYNLSLATLKSPIDGVVVEVNGNVVETIKVDIANSDNALIKILSDSNFTTEVLVEENDIAQIALDQKVEITLDAIEDLTLDGTVNFISSTATRDSNGIISYLVRIEIADDQGAPIREGMTTQVSFIMGEALDVLAVPNEALVEETYVTLEDGSKQKVETGFSDGNLTEIKSGLKPQQVILIGADQSGLGGSEKNADTDIETRMEAIGERLQASGEKPANWERMSVSEKQDFLKALRSENSPFGGGSGNDDKRPSGASRP